MHEPLADRRHDLLVLADQRAVRADVDLAVEHGADGVRHLLAHADHHIGVGVARRRAQRVDLGPGNLDRVLEQLDRQPVGDRAGRGVVVIPDRMRRNEPFRKPDHARAVAAGLADQPAGLFGRAFAVEKHRRGLHGGDLDDRVDVAHAHSDDSARRLLGGLRLRLGAGLGPIVRRGLRLLERVHGFEARRHRGVGAGENLMVLDIERPQPALLAHGQGHEIADLDQFGLAEMLVQARPERVVDRQVPGDRLRVGQRRLLALVVAARALEIDQVAVIVLDDALLGRLDGALVAAELAQHRARHVDAAEFLDAVVGDAVLEHVAPGIGERPEHRRHMGADRLALRTRRALLGASIELGEHGRILDGCRVDVADPWVRHRYISLVVSCALAAEAWTVFVQHADLFGNVAPVACMLPQEPRAINTARAMLTCNCPCAWALGGQVGGGTLPCFTSRDRHAT